MHLNTDPFRAPLAKATLLALLVVFSTAPRMQAAAPTPAWTFQADFTHGIPNWLSYPLVQDEGFDPTIYTKSLHGSPALVRDVVAYGQRILRVGLLASLKFRAIPSTTIGLTYSLEMGGRLEQTRVMLASADGRLYSVAIPSSRGLHTVFLTGKQWGLPNSGVSVDAVVVEAVVAAPILGSHNRLVIRSFRINAEVQSGLSLKAPQLKLGRIPPHPRILLTASRLARLRSNRALVKIVHQKATQFRQTLAYNPRAGHSVSLLSPSSVFPGLKQYFQLMDSYSSAIAFNALDYRLSGDPEALSSARRALDCVAAWQTWTPPWFPAHGLHTYYEVGVFMQKVAFGYDLVAGKLSQSEKERITEAFWNNGIQPTLEDYFVNDRLPDASSNWMANSVGGAIAACVALYGDTPEWNRRLGMGLSELVVDYEKLLQGLFPGDGSEAEPAGYENFAMEGMSWGAAALQALGIHPHGMTRMLDSFWWLRYAQFAPGKFLDTGDFGTDLMALSGFAWPAENARNQALMAFYQGAQSKTLSSTERAQHTGGALSPAPGLLDMVCCTWQVRGGLAGGAPWMPEARVFPGRGSAVMRSGWSPGATVVSIRVGPWFNHEHHDQGSFQVAAFGEKMIAEAGYTNYYTDPRYVNYFTQAPGHNTVILDNDPFSQEDYDGRYWPALHDFAKFRAQVFSPTLDYLSANLAPAYNDEWSPRPRAARVDSHGQFGAQINRGALGMGRVLREFTRQFIFIKPDILIVRDHLESTSRHSFTFYLHIPPGARHEIEPDGFDALISRQSGLATLAAAGRASAWKVESTPIPVTAYENLDRKAVVPRDTFILAAPPSTAADFMVGMRFQPSKQKMAFLDIVNSASGRGFRAGPAGPVVWFRTAPGTLTAATSLGTVTTDGDVLAVQSRAGASDIFVARASRLEVAGEVVFSAQPGRVDADLNETSRGLAVYADCLRGTTLRLHARRRPAQTLIDGKKMSAFQARTVTIARLTKGRHIIQVQY